MFLRRQLRNGRTYDVFDFCTVLTSSTPSKSTSSGSYFPGRTTTGLIGQQLFMPLPINLGVIGGPSRQLTIDRHRWNLRELIRGRKS